MDFFMDLKTCSRIFQLYFMDEKICEDDRHRKTIENVWKRKLRTYKPCFNNPIPRR